MARRAGLPTGTVTFLRTDVEGSTRLWEQHAAAMQAVIARHDELVAACVRANDGVLLKSRGEGDSTLSVFARASDAVAAALDTQLSLEREAWPASIRIAARMAVHTGETELRDGDYYGPAVNRCSRLRDVAHGGQVLLSRATTELVRETLPAEATLRDLGPHRLKDLSGAEHVSQLCHPGLRTEFPALRSLDSSPNNLPVQLTSFVGREREMGEVRDLLSRARLVSLAGTGGVGKTRLALQLAPDALDAHPDGVWFVDLSAISDPALIQSEVVSALGLRSETSDPRDSLSLYLRSRASLLILDNCEHVAADCAELVRRLLVECPALAILATTREPLGVAGEATWRVPPLQVPEAGATDQDLDRNESVRLFCDRARLRAPDFTLRPDNAPAVARICVRLEGIPLAIELAAARSNALSPQQIADRLDDVFGLLTTGGRTAVGRQQTLRAAVDWSYDLLNDAQRVLLRRLSVFSGSFTLEAAEHVCSIRGMQPSDVLDLLSELVDRSLVVTQTGAASVRYRLHEPIRRYALEKLTEPEGAVPATIRPSADVYVLRREGDFWTVGRPDAVVRLKHSKGLAYLSLLLSNPGREFHVLDVVSASGAPREAGVSVLDADARSAYAQRAAELREELEEAQAWDDAARASRAREELDALAGELSRAVGLGGRTRTTASASERARTAATSALRNAIGKVEEHDAVLGAYLGTTIRTGTFFSYLPDARHPVSFTF